MADRDPEGRARLCAPVADRPLDGRIRDGHPRILLPGLRAWDGRGLAPLMQERLALFQTQGIDTSAYDPCRGPGPLGAAVCWVSTGDDQAGQRGLAALPGFQVETPGASTEYGNLWELAWTYDLLGLHPAMDGALRQTVEGNIEAALIGYLSLLDGESASLWHGRSTLAAQAWLAALVLGPGGPARVELVRRAQGHFADTLRAILIAQAWPEGYNYWINARALVVGLAAAGMVNGLTEANGSDLALRALERIGLWAVYATRHPHRYRPGHPDPGRGPASRRRSQIRDPGRLRRIGKVGRLGDVRRLGSGLRVIALCKSPVLITSCSPSPTSRRHATSTAAS